MGNLFSTSNGYNVNDVVEICVNHNKDNRSIGIIRNKSGYKYGIELMKSNKNVTTGIRKFKGNKWCPNKCGVIASACDIVQKLPIDINTNSIWTKLYNSCLIGLEQRNNNINRLEIELQKERKEKRELQIKCNRLQNTKDQVQKLLSDCCNTTDISYEKILRLALNECSYQHKNDINTAEIINSEYVDEDDDLKEINRKDTIIDMQFDLKEQEIIKLKDIINALNETMCGIKRKYQESTIMLTNLLFEKNDLNEKIQKNDDLQKKQHNVIGKYKAQLQNYNRLIQLIDQLKHIIANKNEEIRQLKLNYKGEKKKVNKAKGGMVGLESIGNTCWMNSIIQCVSHVPMLVEYVSKNELNGNVSKSLKMIINNIWNFNEPLMNKLLHKFKYEMSTVSTMYATTGFQDPAEFLDHLLNVLHNELNTASSEYANNDLIIGNGMPDNMVSLLSWKAYEKSNNSPIIDLFYGQHKSSIMCANEECKYNYVIFEPFKILAVSTVCIKQEQYSKKGTLYDCIDKYVSENKLINTNWYCSKCKQDLPNSIEQIQLYKFPKVLIIQLKKK
eukprot:454602_1